MKRKTLSLIIALLLMAQPLTAFASSKSATGYFAPYGSVPDLGLVVAWGIDLSLDVYYTQISSSSSRLDDAYFIASMSPKATEAAGNGQVGGTLKEKADGSSYSSRSLASLPGFVVIHDPSTFIYQARKYHSLRVFNSSATIQVPVAYTNTNASWLFNTTGTVTVTVNR